MVVYDLLPFGLDAEQVDDVGSLDDLIQVVTDFDAKPLDLDRDQRGRAANGQGKNRVFGVGLCATEEPTPVRSNSLCQA